MRRLAALLFVVALACAESREDLLRRWREEGQERLDRARHTLALRKEEAAKRRAAEDARLREVTKTRPVDFDLGGTSLKRCVILEVQDDGFLVRAADPPVQMKVLFAAIPPRQLLDLRRAMIDPEDIEARFALGRLAARAGLYPEAEKEFAWVVARDPSYEGRLPDLEALKRRAVIFHGQMTALGADRYRVAYDFLREEEGNDFVVEGGEAWIEKGSLFIEADDFASVALREVALSGEVSLAVEAPPAAEGVRLYWGLSFACAGGRAFAVFVGRDGAHGYVVLQSTSESDWEDVADFDVPASAAVRIVLSQGTRVAVLVGETEIWSKHVDPVQTCQVLLEAADEAPGSFTVSFERVVVEGRIPREFLRKLQVEAEAIALRTLEEDLALPPPVAGAMDRPLSAELLCPEPVAKEELEELRRLRAVFAQEEVDDEVYEASVAALRAMAKARPRFAGPWFAIAEAMQFEGRDDLVLDALDRAIEIEPCFHEALAARAAVHVERRDWDRAWADIEAALAVWPDSAAAIRARGRLAVGEKRYADAIADFEMALTIDPEDGLAKSYLKAARHLLRGPWPDGSEYRKETEHYVVRTDISQEKAELYARRLEKARAIFVKGMLPAPGATRKAEVLIFDSEEAYHTYAELTGDDRAESTLGYYSPFYEQLLLFEGATDVTGLTTLHTLYHEGFHQYLDPIMADPPAWIDEGLADYYAGRVLEAELGGKKDPDLVQMVSELQRALAVGWDPDFEAMMAMSQDEFYDDAAYTRYAQAWAMCLWFQEVAEEETRAAFASYLAALREGKGHDEAYEAAFGEVDLDALERRWLEWVGSLEH